MKTLILILSSALILTGCWGEKKTEKVAIPGAEVVSSTQIDTVTSTSTGNTTTSKTPYYQTP